MGGSKARSSGIKKRIDRTEYISLYLVIVKSGEMELEIIKPANQLEFSREEVNLDAEPIVLNTINQKHFHKGCKFNYDSVTCLCK